MPNTDPLKDELRFIHSPNSSIHHIYAEHLSKEFLEHAARIAETAYFTHATPIPFLDIQLAGRLRPGTGCLGAVVYCVPAPLERERTHRLHNFGLHVLRHKQGQRISPLILKVKFDELKVSGVNYLRFGHLFFLATAQIAKYDGFEQLQHDQALRMSFATEVTTYFQNRHAHSELCYTIHEATELIDKLFYYLSTCRFLSYFYFEAVSIALMLVASDEKTVNLRSQGELNTKLYIDLIDELRKKQCAERFDIKSFAPNLGTIFSLIDNFETKGVIVENKQSFTILLCNLLITLIGENISTPEHIKGWIAYDFVAHSEEVERTSTMEGIVSEYLRDYWQKENIGIVYNSIVDKGEFGICPPETGGSSCRVYRAEYLSSGCVKRHELLRVKIAMN